MHLYLIQSAVTGCIKVGRADNPIERLYQLQTGSPYRLKIIKVFEYLGDYERDLHKILGKHGLRIRKDGEWFDSDSLRYFPEDLLLDFNWETEYWWKTWKEK